MSTSAVVSNSAFALGSSTLLMSSRACSITLVSISRILTLWVWGSSWPGMASSDEKLDAGALSARRQIDPKPLALVGPALGHGEPGALDNRTDALQREFVTVLGMNCFAARKLHFQIERRNGDAL